MRSQNSEVRTQKHFNPPLWLIFSLAIVLGAFILVNAMGATDDFQANKVELHSPPANGFVITPADGADLGNITRSIWVGTGGDIVVIYAGNRQQVTLKNVPTGARLPGRFARVLSTNTTASNLVGEY